LDIFFGAVCFNIFFYPEVKKCRAGDAGEVGERSASLLGEESYSQKCSCS